MGPRDHRRLKAAGLLMADTSTAEPVLALENCRGAPSRILDHLVLPDEARALAPCDSTGATEPTEEALVVAAVATMLDGILVARL